MKMTIKSWNGLKCEVDCFSLFEMFGYQFAAHHDYEYDKDIKEWIKLGTWAVSEISTGAKVLGGYKKRKDVIKCAQNMIEKAGRNKLDRAIQLAKKTIKKAN